MRCSFNFILHGVLNLKAAAPTHEMTMALQTTSRSVWERKHGRSGELGKGNGCKDNGNKAVPGGFLQVINRSRSHGWDRSRTYIPCRSRSWPIDMMTTTDRDGGAAAEEERVPFGKENEKTALAPSVTARSVFHTITRVSSGDTTCKTKGNKSQTKGTKVRVVQHRLLGRWDVGQARKTAG